MNEMASCTVQKPLPNVFQISEGYMCNCFFLLFALPLSSLLPSMWKERERERQEEVDHSGWGELSHLIATLSSALSDLESNDLAVMKHQWRRARKGEDYTAWAIHGTIHPFIALGFPHSQSRKYSWACEGWMWAGGGWQECWGNHSDKWCISSLYCALCFDMTTPLWGRTVE